MPGALTYVPPNDSWRPSLPPVLLSEITQRHRQYVNALKYYKGEHVEQLAYNPDEEPNDNVAINLVKTAADRTAQFLLPEMPGFETDPNTPDQTEEEKYIKGFFEANGGLPFLIK